LLQGHCFSDGLNVDPNSQVAGERTECGHNGLFALIGFNNAADFHWPTGCSMHRNLLAQIRTGLMDESQHFDFQFGRSGKSRSGRRNG
jgi:hypothetical protein